MIQPILKSCLLVLWIGVLCISGWIAKKLKRFDRRDRIVRLCYRGLLRIAGIQLTITGTPAEARPLLLITNHLSYLDVVLLGSSLPVRFTPKAEVARWPIIGSICRMCDAIFVDRRPEMIHEMKEKLRKVFEQRNMVVLFPEGTTGNGLHVMPFKSSFFSLAEEPVNGKDLVVQPASITYTHICSLPIDSSQWPEVAWYGDMQLVPHLFNFLKLGPVQAKLEFLPPVTIKEYGDRKALAAHCQAVITDSIAATRQSNLMVAKKRPPSRLPRNFLGRNRSEP